MKGAIKGAQRGVRATGLALRRASGAPPLALLAYSRNHFDPRGGGRYPVGWSSAGQLAGRIYSALRDLGLSIAYRGEVHRYWNLRAYDLVFSCMASDTRHVEARFRVSFPAMSHVSAMDSRICLAAERYGERYPEYVFGTEECNRWREELSASSLVIAIGNGAVADTFRGEVEESRLAVINSAIDSEVFPFLARPMERPVFVHNPTTLSVCKGTYHLLEAWPRVRSACPDCELWIMGQPGRETGWRGRIEQPGVTYLGPYVGAGEDHVNRLTRANFVVLPSLSEGQPGCVLEAMSCGCVPILFRTAGLDAANYGGLEAEFDSVESLTEQMIVAAGLGDAWQERSAQARAAVEALHSWSVFEARMKESLVGSLPFLREPARKDEMDG